NNEQGHFRFLVPNPVRQDPAGLGVEFESVDAFTVGFGGVGTDKGEVGVICGGFLCATGEGKGNQGRNWDRKCSEAASSFHEESSVAQEQTKKAGERGIVRPA